MRKAAYDMFVLSYAENAKNWEIMKNEFPDIQVKAFPSSVIKAMKKANQELLDENAAKDELAAKIIKSQRDYLKSVRVWTEISEFGYLESVKD